MARKPDELDTEVRTIERPAASGEDFHSGQFRTKFASEAVGLADIFQMLIGSIPLRGPATFRVELAAPDGPSTGGGVQSVQHIKLIAEDGGATLVAGWADQKAETCELRTLDYLDAQHTQRFRRSSLKAPPAPSERLDRKHYAQLLERLRTFFAERDLMVQLVDVPEPQTMTRLGEKSPLRRAQPSPPSRIAMVLLGALLGLAIAGVAWLFVRR